MHRDKKVGLALGILLIGIVAAFFFRNESVEVETALPLKNAEQIDSKIAEKSVTPYLTGVEFDDSDDRFGEFEPAPSSRNHAAPADSNSSSKDESAGSARRPPQPPRHWELPDFLRENDDREISGEPAAQVESTPDPIPLGSQEDLASSIPTHNNAWQIAEERVTTNERRENPESNPTANKRAIVHQVQRGDSLWKLAGRYLGDAARFHEIYVANRDIMKSPNDLREGMRITIPTNGQRTIPPRNDRRSNASFRKPNRTTGEPPNKEKPRFSPADRSPFFPARPVNRSNSSTGQAKSVKRLTQVPPVDLPNTGIDRSPN